jgi:hypothetical protein
VDFGRNFSARHRGVLHIGIEASETAGRESSRLAFVKAISHSNFEGSGDDGDVFRLKMPTWLDTGIHLQTHCVIPVCSTWIALISSIASCAPPSLKFDSLRIGLSR